MMLNWETQRKGNLLFLSFFLTHNYKNEREREHVKITLHTGTNVMMMVA
jgi:hypothetical protein